MAVSQCQASSGGDYVRYYEACLAEQWTSGVSWSIRFNYSVVYGNAHIGSWWDNQYSCFMCEYRDQSIYKRSETQIRWTGTVVNSLGAGSYTKWLEINASTSGAWTNHN